MKNPSLKVNAALELMEAYVASGVQPTNLDHALAALNDFVNDDVLRVNRGGGCLLCGFETWYAEWLIGAEAVNRLRTEHQEQHPTCEGQITFYGGDLREEEIVCDENEDL